MTTSKHSLLLLVALTLLCASNVHFYNLSRQLSKECPSCRCGDDTGNDVDEDVLSYPRDPLWSRLPAILMIAKPPIIEYIAQNGSNNQRQLPLDDARIVDVAQEDRGYDEEWLAPLIGNANDDMFNCWADEDAGDLNNTQDSEKENAEWVFVDRSNVFKNVSPLELENHFGGAIIHLPMNQTPMLAFDIQIPADARNNVPLEESCISVDMADGAGDGVYGVNDEYRLTWDEQEDGALNAEEDQFEEQEVVRALVEYSNMFKNASLLELDISFGKTHFVIVFADDHIEHTSAEADDSSLDRSVLVGKSPFIVFAYIVLSCREFLLKCLFRVLSALRLYSSRSSASRSDRRKQVPLKLVGKKKRAGHRRNSSNAFYPKTSSRLRRFNNAKQQAEAASSSPGFWLRSLQYLAVMLFLTCPLLCLVLSFMIVYWVWSCIGQHVYGLCVSIFITFVVLPYPARYASKRGGLAISCARRCRFWKLFCDCFPVRVHVDQKSPTTTDQPVVFGVHPHGIIAFGAIGAFAHDHFKPANTLNVSLLTLGINFGVPFWGSMLSCVGIAEASKQCINTVLGRGSGHAVALVVGGAKESLDAHPSLYRLTLSRRQGFVKMALLNGACLVPVLCFGETNTFTQAANAKGTRLRRLQDSVQAKLGVAFPLLTSLPQPSPINVVFGSPIRLPHLNAEQMTQEIVTHYHQLYIQDLKALFHRHRHHDPSAQTIEIV